MALNAIENIHLNLEIEEIKCENRMSRSFASTYFPHFNHTYLKGFGAFRVEERRVRLIFVILNQITNCVLIETNENGTVSVVIYF